jgi:hypothetical protein
MKQKILCCILVSTLATTIHAQNLITNSGFENPSLTGTFLVVNQGNSIGGWTVLGSSTLLLRTDHIEPGVSFASQEGLNSLDLTGNVNVGTSAGVTQNISTVIGQVYNISFYVGRASGSAFYATPSTADLSINGGVRTSFTNAGATSGTTNWQQFLTTFTAVSTSTSIAFYNATTSNNFVGLDNVSVTAAPEPATISLLTLGIFGTGLHSRRTRRVKI